MIFESVKLALQFVGALIVANLAVNWALRRFKAEKTWEKRLSAYADAIDSLLELQTILQKWEDVNLDKFHPSDEFSSIQNRRYQDARRRLIGCLSLAILLLPEVPIAAIRSALDALEDTPNHSEYDAYLHNNMQLTAIGDALAKVKASANETLGVAWKEPEPDPWYTKLMHLRGRS